MKISLPGDKSVSHRALMLAAISDGPCRITNLPQSADVTSTRTALEQCGIEFSESKGALVVSGRGGAFDTPDKELDLGNSGTTARLLMGLLAGRGIQVPFTGDISLSRRPMARVVFPLLEMGAKIHISARETLPVTIFPSDLNALEYTLPVASAQVKSALLLAGLSSRGKVIIHEPLRSRDHTERMLKSLGVDLETVGDSITVGEGPQSIPAFDIHIPGDVSSAAFPAALAAMTPGKKIIFDNLLLNQTRMGFFTALKEMGANVEWKVTSTVLGEDVGRLTVQSADLQGIVLKGDVIPRLIDEIPILAILATRAKGVTIVRDAGELRLKECDRIKAVCENIRRMGARIQEFGDGFRILGPMNLRGATISTYGDHRIAMAFSVAGKLAGSTRLDDPDCVNISYPGFHAMLDKLAR